MAGSSGGHLPSYPWGSAVDGEMTDDAVEAADRMRLGLLRLPGVNRLRH
jgi:hypothetical protein